MVGHDLVLEHSHLRVAFGQGLNLAPDGSPFLAEAYPCLVRASCHRPQSRPAILDRHRHQVDAPLVVVVPEAPFVSVIGNGHGGIWVRVKLELG